MALLFKLNSLFPQKVDSFHLDVAFSDDAQMIRIISLPGWLSSHQDV